MTPDADDSAALELAMAQAMQDARRAVQLNEMLKDEPWVDVAKFAAFCCQSAALKIRLWERAPCIADNPLRPGQPPDLVGKRLLERMVAAGVSRWHPDPLGALDGPKRFKRAKCQTKYPMPM